MTTKTNIPPIKVTSSSPKPPPKPDPAVDAPLLVINNPLTYFYRWLEAIKNWIKKDADGEIRIHIPFKWFLAALTIIVAGGVVPAYLKGKAVEHAWWITKPTPTPIVIIKPTVTPAPVQVTKIGTIKASYQVKNILPTTPPTLPPSTDEASLAPFASPTAPIASRFVLVARNGQINFLSSSTGVNFASFLNEKVLITGYYRTKTNTLEVVKTADIELLP